MRLRRRQREPLVRLRPIAFVSLVTVLLGGGVFYIAVIGGNDDHAPGLLSGTAALAFVRFFVVAIAALAVDVVVRDFCLLSEEGTTVVVHLPFALDRLLNGYRFEAEACPDLRVELIESESDSRVRATVMSNAQVLRSLSLPAMQLDTATRQRCHPDEVIRP